MNVRNAVAIGLVLLIPASYSWWRSIEAALGDPPPRLQVVGIDSGEWVDRKNREQSKKWLRAALPRDGPHLPAGVRTQTGVTPFFRIRFPYLFVSPVITTQKADFACS